MVPVVSVPSSAPAANLTISPSARLVTSTSSCQKVAVYLALVAAKDAVGMSALNVIKDTVQLLMVLALRIAFCPAELAQTLIQLNAYPATLVHSSMGPLVRSTYPATSATIALTVARALAMSWSELIASGAPTSTTASNVARPTPEPVPSANPDTILMEPSVRSAPLSARHASATASAQAASPATLFLTQLLKDNASPASLPASHAQVQLPTVLLALLAIPRRTGSAKTISTSASASR